MSYAEMRNSMYLELPLTPRQADGPHLDYALWLTIRELEPYWMPDFQAGKLTFGGDAKKIAFALNAVGNKDTVKPVVALIDGGKVPKENLHGLYLLLARSAGPRNSGRYSPVRLPRTSPIRRSPWALVVAIETAVLLRKVGSPRNVDSLAPLLRMTTRPAGQAAARLAGHWKAVQMLALLAKQSTRSFPSSSVRRRLRG